MTAHYVLASDALKRKELSKAKAWVETTDYQTCKGTIMEALAEYNANKKGFTIFKHKATYPKST